MEKVVIIIFFMRALYIHAKEFYYNPVKRTGLSVVEEVEPSSHRFKDVLVVFVSVEEGDFDRRGELIDAFINDVSNHLNRLKVSSLVIYPYAHLSDRLEEPRKAVRLLKLIDRRMKGVLTGINYHRAPFGWYKEFMIHCLGHPLSELSRRF